ncbi:hypothetical protein ACP4I1_16165 [Streptomyces sp. WG4]|uniref:hypothetical protein n=1 Tax=Streptomyces sp. WG4 TaxID=3417649 RepID=UPI003CE8455A
MPPAPCALAGRPCRPVPGGDVRARPADRREAARAVFDHSAVTDADALLRRHGGEEHEA